MSEIESVDHPFVDHCRRYADMGSLREVVINYFVENFGTEMLPRDDRECHAVIVAGMAAYADVGLSDDRAP